MDDLKNELAGLMKEVPPSIIPLEKPSTELVRVDVNINSLNREIWGSKSNQLLDDYKYGEALAKYGEAGSSAKTFMKRFAESFYPLGCFPDGSWLQTCFPLATKSGRDRVV